ncbi:MAG: transposase [Desulfovibrio sp.]|nr:transposase [Desulfovibrio sp.]
MIRIILDKYLAHTSKAVLAYLAGKISRFQFAFTPALSSWLNLVERFFGKMASQCLNKPRVKSKEERIVIITRLMDDANNAPVIYYWKWNLEDIVSAFN